LKEKGKRPVPAASVSDWDGTVDINPRALLRMARVTASLFARPEEWIHRRVERIYFKDHQVAHHQISVDFTLPRNVVPVSTFEGKPVYVAPLFLLAKDSHDPLRVGKRPRKKFYFIGKRSLDLTKRTIPSTRYSNVNFTNQEGHSLPILTRNQSAQLTAAMLLQEAERIVGSGRVNGQLRNEIAAIPFRSWLDLQGVLNWLLHEKVCCWDARLKLRKDEDFKELIYTFARHYLIVCLLTGNEPRRPIYKLSYDEYSNVGATKPKGAIRRSLGWMCEQYSVSLTEIGASSSYHVEIDIPKELEINAINLVGKLYRWFDKIRDAGNRDYLIRQIQITNEGKIYIPEPLPGRRVGHVWVKLRARRKGFPAGALAASFLITIMLILASFNVFIIVRNNESEAATATLLLAPALVAVYIVRPEEHDITKRMLRWMRWALVVDALLLGVGIYFILTMRHQKTEHILAKIGYYHFSYPPPSWLILVGISTVIFVLLSLSNILPQPRGENIYSIEQQS
jgi:hypothetical protein